MAGAFSLALNEFAEKAGDNADTAIREVVLEVFSRVVSRSTPVVDTGRFRANWQYGLGEAPQGEVAAAAAVETGQTDLSGKTPRSPAPAPSIAPGSGWGYVHYIVNNVPYARPLEYDHSKKGGKMVRTTIADFAGIVDGAAAKVRDR